MSDIADNNRRENHSSGEKNDTGFFKRLVDKVMKSYDYIMGGVWSDTRGSWKVNIMKTLSLTVKSFFNADLQTRAAALTYQTVLTIVPALALLFAIGRGFGFQNLLKSQLFSYMPAQRSAWEQALEFVDSYLAQASEGLFVGIGIPFLLWTLISLVSKVEECFNKIWGIPRGRSLWRKITDYTAIFLILPVLMICSSGITVFMSSTLQATLPFDFMSPVIGWLLDGASLVLTWLFFAGIYAHPQHESVFQKCLHRGHPRRLFVPYPTMAVCIGTDICNQVQCHIWFIFIAASASDMAAVSVAYNPCGRACMLFVTEYLPVQFLE